jgi:hypothetical protein
MKNIAYRNRFITPLLALAIPAASAMGGTSEPVAAPSPAPSCMDWLKVSGYAAIAYTYTDSPGIFSDDHETFADGNTPFDAVKVGFTGSYGSFGGYVSLFYTPGVAGDDAGILDAYATYKAGDFTITAGKYLSYLGYEAFDAVNMTQITYANSGLGAIPAYHNGVKIDYATDAISAGLSVSDSIRGGDGFWTGDEEFSDDQGYEAYVSYKGIDKLTLWAGLGYENTDGGDDWVTYDFWASYSLTDKLTIAGEVAYHDDGAAQGIQGLGFAQYKFTDKFSTVFRIGFDDVDNAPNNYRYTFAPTYAFCENFLIRAEVSFNDVKADDEDYVFSGIQALAKF